MSEFVFNLGEKSSFHTFKEAEISFEIIQNNINKYTFDFYRNLKSLDKRLTSHEADLVQTYILKVLSHSFDALDVLFVSNDIYPPISCRSNNNNSTHTIC